VVFIEHATRSEDAHVAKLSSGLDASRQATANDRHRKKEPQWHLVVIGTPVSLYKDTTK
jgi:hypothetical protein